MLPDKFRNLLVGHNKWKTLDEIGRNFGTCSRPDVYGVIRAWECGGDVLLCPTMA
jgi:hypothetical protein